ncbi:MAG: hypothetical protein PVG45_12300 [Gammaproteobacteria bacterium]
MTESDIRAGVIAFVNMATSPGLEGAVVNVDDENRQSEQIRSSLGFSAEFTLRDHIFNGYWGVALVGGTLDDDSVFIADDNTPVSIDLKRKLVGLRGSFGLSFPITQHFRIRPFVSLSASDMQSEIRIDDLITFPPATTPTPVFATTSATIVSGTLSLEALYSRWYGNYQLELGGQINDIHTDSFSEDSSILDINSRNQTAQFKIGYSGPTSLISYGRPWRWKIYSSYYDFITQEKASLGYTALFEIGASLNWEMNIKPLNWFGWKTIGLSAGYITGRDVEGYNIGLIAQ